MIPTEFVRFCVFAAKGYGLRGLADMGLDLMSAGLILEANRELMPRRAATKPAPTTSVDVASSRLAGVKMRAMAEKALDFGVLGPLQVTVDGTPLALGTPKQKAVLAMLIINRNRPVATHALIEAAWEQWPPAAP